MLFRLAIHNLYYRNEQHKPEKSTAFLISAFQRISSPPFLLILEFKILQQHLYVCMYVCVYTHTHTHTYIYIYTYIRKSYPCNRPWRPIGFWDVKAPTFSRHFAHRWWWRCQIYAPAALYHPGKFLVLISVRGWVDPWAIVQLEGKGKLKNPMTLSWIEPVNVRLVA
jgi:hypothetical protein